MRSRDLVVALALLLPAACCSSGENQAQATIELRIVDAEDQKPTPARIELLDENGKAYIAEDAVPVGPGYEDRVIPWQGDIEKALSLLSRSVANPYTRTTQFYSSGNSRVRVPRGNYRLRIYKGIEYRLETREVTGRPGRTAILEVAMPRWVDMPREGWYSADDHMHISRPLEELDPIISKWMQAEDIHVANLLQFGTYKRFVACPQYAHGRRGIYREGDYMLVPGQEHPRTHILGHTAILGAGAPIHFPDRYFIYRTFWEEARKLGGVSGFAHWGTADGAPNGLAIDLPSGLITFLQVLEAWDANYDLYYEILNLGFRVTPTAGTDYGSLPALPGRERFFTRLQGPLTLENWQEGIRAGRTFVTNGPVLKFQVQGKEMGEEVLLQKPGAVRVEARALFDPARDDVDRLEVVRNGTLIRSCPCVAPEGEIRCSFECRIEESSWLAARTWGKKVGEASPPEGFVPPYRNRYRGAPASLAHTAAVYVTIQGAPGVARRALAAEIARAWLARLADLEQRLAEDRISYLTAEAGEYVPDAAYLRAHREELLEAIRKARAHYERVTR
ncbi:MAG: CehA/McbA family metallohydrolase [Acidobacteria bacterium]|nr:CehA/McbA family metallohydrolase [Acidobacteriota bacterium]